VTDVVDTYVRVPIFTDLTGTTKGAHKFFLYAVHFTDANHINLGFGTESQNGLNMAHMPGPVVHELHISQLTDWMRGGGLVRITEPTKLRTHPFSSIYDVDMTLLLQTEHELPLTAGRYFPMLTEVQLSSIDMRRYADAIDKLRIKAFGHPMDWDVKFSDLADGRFVWMAYDNDIQKIRVGMGYHDAANERVFGTHSYAVSQREAAGFAAFHHYYLDAPLQFMGLPPRWPHGLSPFLHGKIKQTFARDFLLLADVIWPGGVQAPSPEATPV